MRRAPVDVALIHPEIPQNTGNVARTCAAAQVPLHLVEPLGFRLTNRYLKRAGLDYWPHVMLTVHPDQESFTWCMQGRRLVLFSARARESYVDFPFEWGDCLVFGAETTGLPPEWVEGTGYRTLKIPILSPHVRSLNLATSVGIVLYEALRQVGIIKQKSRHRPSCEWMQLVTTSETVRGENSVPGQLDEKDDHERRGQRSLAFQDGANLPRDRADGPLFSDYGKG